MNRKQRAIEKRIRKANRRLKEQKVGGWIWYEPKMHS